MQNRAEHVAPLYAGTKAMSSIVIVEDDHLMRALLSEWLLEEGYSTTSTMLHHVPATGKVDLVIVDIHWPRRAAERVVAAIRATYPGTPLIAISGHFRSGAAGDCPAAHALGVHNALPKPFSRNDLLAAVRSVIGPPS
jgi:CheY-like chemotaxis protein